MQQFILEVPVPGDDQPDGQTRQLAYTEFGDPANPNVLVCVHGVSRLGRDFDVIAENLSDTYRVVCPDMAGRGDSDWLESSEDYSYPLYLSDIAALLKHIGASTVHWIGTSMGGLIGMMLAAQKESPIVRLVINDIGAVVPAASMKRIGTYLGTDRTFADTKEGEAYLRDVHASFGPLTDAEWAHLAKYGLKPVGDGSDRVRLHYDPKIAAPFKAGSDEDIVLWKLWDRITCPVMVLHGAESDLLLSETAAEMATRGPKADVRTLAGIGHAPALMSDKQIAMVRSWLLEK
ncbi:MAG: alpha/beta hydrolase [Rhodospirillaceae bacterium]|nr:alpha/beta hydrolase [Rhodospirillaceae bacterium]